MVPERSSALKILKLWKPLSLTGMAQFSALPSLPQDAEQVQLSAARL